MDHMIVSCVRHDHMYDLVHRPHTCHSASQWFSGQLVLLKIYCEFAMDPVDFRRMKFHRYLEEKDLMNFTKMCLR